MSTEHAMHTSGNVALLPNTDVEARLDMSRAILRQRLMQNRADDKVSVWAHINDMTNRIAPLARQTVRQRPYVSLSVAALAGILLVRFKPWRAFGGPLLLGILARQAFALSLSRGSQIVSTFLVSAAKRKKSHAPESH